MANHTATFRKSTFSDGDNGCVEVARPVASLQVRDSKNTDGPVLSFAEPRGLLFLGWVKRS